MAKYDPLEAHLRRQKTATYEMTFRDIERVLAALLPRRAWAGMVGKRGGGGGRPRAVSGLA